MTDRELDALVAEKVFGWKEIAESPINGALCGSKPDGEHGYKYEIPRYGSDIAAAWQVVEEMESCGKRVTIHREGSGDDWAADFGHGYYAAANEPARAICLAALKAIGVEAPSPSAEGKL